MAFPLVRVAMPVPLPPIIDKFDDDTIDNVLLLCIDDANVTEATAPWTLSVECNRDDDDDNDDTTLVVPVLMVEVEGVWNSSMDVSSVSGSERVRWWKQFKWFTFVKLFRLLWLFMKPMANVAVAAVADAAVVDVDVDDVGGGGDDNDDDDGDNDEDNDDDDATVSSELVFGIWFKLLVALVLQLLLIVRSILLLLQLLLLLLFSVDVDATTKFIGTFDVATVDGDIVVIGNEKALWWDTVRGVFDAIEQPLFAPTVNGEKHKQKTEKKSRNKQKNI